MTNGALTPIVPVLALTGGVPLTLWLSGDDGILFPLAEIWAIVWLLAVIILPMRWYLWGRRRFMETYGRGCPTCGYPIGTSAVCPERGSDLTPAGETSPQTPRSTER